MRTTDDQLREILKRSDQISQRRDIFRKAVTSTASLFVCIGLLLLTAAYLPAVSQAGADVGTAEQYGSLILGTAHMGYVVIGVLAFMAGIFTALLARYWKKWKELGRC